MERLDAMVAGIGVLVVGVALLGVATSGPGGGEAAFLLTFPTAATELPEATGTFAGDASTDVVAGVPLRNLTQLVFDVTVASGGASAGPTTIVVQVEGPQGQQDEQQLTMPVVQAQASSVSATLRFGLAQAPANTPVRAGSAGEAAAGAGPGTMNGTGDWTITVTAQSGQLGLANRATYTVSVVPTATTYAAVAQPEAANPR